MLVVSPNPEERLYRLIVFTASWLKRRAKSIRGSPSWAKAENLSSISQSGPLSQCVVGRSTKKKDQVQIVI